MSTETTAPATSTEVTPEIPATLAGLELPRNGTTGAPYRGDNVLRLLGAQLEAGYAGGEWAGYQQWVSAKRQVRKGEKSTAIVAVGVATDKKTGRASTFARATRVFHRDQTDPILEAAAVEAGARIEAAAVEAAAE